MTSEYGAGVGVGDQVVALLHRQRVAEDAVGVEHAGDHDGVGGDLGLLVVRRRRSPGPSRCRLVDPGEGPLLDGPLVPQAGVDALHRAGHRLRLDLALDLAARPRPRRRSRSNGTIGSSRLAVVGREAVVQPGAVEVGDVLGVGAGAHLDLLDAGSTSSSLAPGSPASVARREGPGQERVLHLLGPRRQLLRRERARPARRRPACRSAPGRRSSAGGRRSRAYAWQRHAEARRAPGRSRARRSGCRRSSTGPAPRRWARKPRLAALPP